eukprot:TRINITY_DN24987_c0_g1_i1.p1 TRINITY_DN24987_c0_g1~~TRINITY_DN24987_c0_g1_i1.p1  ORF type:complete len:126 (+),score=26.78 TRINITY_DN24987_c0_g1_i1:34-411(+)
MSTFRRVNREKTCPFLLRIFPIVGAHNKESSYAKGDTPKNEIQIHTWMDATLFEIRDLMKELVPDMRKDGGRVSIALVYPDKTSKFTMREVGRIYCCKSGPDDKKTLQDLQLQPGDYLDVAIYLD